LIGASGGLGASSRLHRLNVIGDRRAADSRREMKYVKLGRTGLTVSNLCLGMMTYGSPEWRPWILDEAAARPLF
jgi:hypothetical protein